MAKISKEKKAKIITEVVRSKYQGKLDVLKERFKVEVEKAAKSFYALELSYYVKAEKEGLEEFLNTRTSIYVKSSSSWYNLISAISISAYRVSTELLHGILNGCSGGYCINVSFPIPCNPNIILREADDDFFTEELISVMKEIHTLYAEATEAVKTLNETLNAFTTVKKLLESFPELGSYFPNDSDTNILVSMETLTKAKSLLLSVQDAKEKSNG